MSKTTRAEVEERAKTNGMMPYDIDGIPKGFSWFLPKEVMINGLYHHGHIIAYTPNVEWDWMGAMMYKPVVVPKDFTQEDLIIEMENKAEELLAIYKENIKRRDNGK